MIDSNHDHRDITVDMFTIIQLGHISVNNTAECVKTDKCASQEKDHFHSSGFRGESGGYLGLAHVRLLCFVSMVSKPCSH